MEARRDCDLIMRQASTFVPAALLRAQANVPLGNYADANKELDHVISIEPIPQYYAMAFDQRAWFRATCPNPSFRNPRGAVDDAKKACSIVQWREAEPIRHTRGRLRRVGRFRFGGRYVQQATKAYDAGEMRKQLDLHLALFQKHQHLTSR